MASVLSSYITVPVNYGGSNGVYETKMFLVEHTVLQINSRSLAGFIFSAFYFACGKKNLNSCFQLQNNAIFNVFEIGVT